MWLSPEAVETKFFLLFSSKAMDFYKKAALWSPRKFDRGLLIAKEHLSMNKL